MYDTGLRVGELVAVDVDMLREGNTALYVSTETSTVRLDRLGIVLSVISVGSRSNQSDAEREKVLTVLSSKPVYPADTTVMQKAGRLSRQ